MKRTGRRGPKDGERSEEERSFDIGAARHISHARTFLRTFQECPYGHSEMIASRRRDVPRSLCGEWRGCLEIGRANGQELMFAYSQAPLLCHRATLTLQQDPSARERWLPTCTPKKIFLVVPRKFFL